MSTSLRPHRTNGSFALVVIAVVTGLVTVMLPSRAISQTDDLIRRSAPRSPTSQTATQLIGPNVLPSIVRGAEDQIRLPVRDASSNVVVNQGFTATVTMKSLFSIGYLDLSVQLDSTVGAMTRNRRLTVRLTPVQRHLPSTRAMIVELPLEFAQGSSQVQLKRSLPKWTVGGTYLVEILEDGGVLDGYTEIIGESWPRWANRDSSEALRNQVVVQCLSLGEHANIPSSTDQLLLDHREVPWTLEIGQEDDLPADWRLMRDFDCLIVSTDQLATLKRLPTIRDWIMMGGSLVVLGGTDSEQVSLALDLILNQAAEQKQDYESTILYSKNVSEGSATVWANWIKSAEQLEKIFATEKAQSSGQSATEFAQTDLTYEASPPPRAFVNGNFTGDNQERLQMSRLYLQRFRADAQSFQTAWQDGFAKQVGGGLVIGLPENGLDTSHGVVQLCDFIGFRRSSILQRGVDPVLGDSRRRRWLIPGVAQPPVYTFIGILTLFVVLVGPLAYRWTTRGHRSHLMFFIAPVLALITTISMFGYSIVADGFGTTARIRQLTWIDGRSGDAVERVRSTLFSGISPRAGLRFDPSAEVMLYPDQRRLGWNAMPREITEVRHRVRIDSDQQTFSPSLLPSRTQNQFVSHQVRRDLGTVRFVDLKPFDTAAANLSSTARSPIVSTLPFDLTDLFVRSTDGRYWTIEELEAGETSDIRWISDVREATKSLGDLYNRHRPIGATSEASGARGNRNELRDVVLTINRLISQNRPPVVDGAIEEWLGENLFVKGSLPPGTFVAVSEVSDDAIPVQNANHVESVRYIMGTIQ